MPTETPETDSADDASKAASFEDRVLGLLETLTERVAAVEHVTPKTVRSRPTKDESPPDFYVPPEELRKRGLASLKEKGQSVTMTQHLLDDPRNLTYLPPNLRPVFHPGDLVVLNLDAEIHGGNGKLWGEALGSDSPIGEVLGVLFMDKRYEPKYKVVFKTLTTSGGDGFRESELLPA